MKGLYQWFSERASFFLSDTASNGTSRTVRTEVTVQREAVTLLAGEAAAGFDVCPLCGQKLASEPLDRASLRSRIGSMSQEVAPPDGSSRTNARPGEVQKKL
jgi:hypothetical protein